MPDEIKEVGLEGVTFCYQVGTTFTAIWTKPKEQTRVNIPDYLKISFGMDTPENFCGGLVVLRDDQVKDVITEIIRAKIAEQKRTGKFFAMKIELAKERKTRRKEHAE